jgi:3-hydroxyacyl-[acyl-carrier-protein] dehydratase
VSASAKPAKLPDGMKPLRLGADAVQLLIPHRRPFLFVDRVLGFQSVEGGVGASLLASKAVSANEPVFEGHFRGAGDRPGFALWPGVYTAEGLGQSCNLLLVLLGIERALSSTKTRAEVHEAIASLERACRPDLHAVPESARGLIEALGDPSSRIGLAGALDIKWIEPVLAGATIEYQVTLTHVLGAARRFDIEARVEERPVARGTLTSSSPR